VVFFLTKACFWADASGDLRKFNRLVASTYVQLLKSILSPHSDVAGHVSKISHYLSNSSCILNRLRSHQTRERIIAALKKQLASQRVEIKELETYALLFNNVVPPPIKWSLPAQCITRRDALPGEALL